MTAKKRPKRLDAEAAREGILDAAAKRLAAAGPSGIRLQEVAADAGVSHPTVLHHFGSREQLVQAVIARSVQAINADLVAAIARSTGGEAQLASILDSVFGVLVKSGHGRVVMWLALEGYPLDTVDASLGDVVTATHELRKARRKGARTPPRDDTAQIVVLAALALNGLTILGPHLLASAGLGEGAEASARFRAWMAKLLSRHLDA